MKKIIQKIKIKKLSNPQNSDFTLRFFEEINQSIGIADDKDTYEDFMRIVNSSDKKCEFIFYSIEKNGQIATGAMICDIQFEQTNAVVIIYLFTNKNFRKQGFATELIQSIAQENQQAFFLAEVLDQTKTDPQLAEFENNYAGLATNNREQFWSKNHFEKLGFDYYNPIPDLSNDCNGCIGYNSLWLNNAHQVNVNHELLLRTLKRYFQYGYCANQIEKHKFEAYQKNAEQLR